MVLSRKGSRRCGTGGDNSAPWSKTKLCMAARPEKVEGSGSSWFKGQNGVWGGSRQTARGTRRVRPDLYEKRGVQVLPTGEGENRYGIGGGYVP